jgi:hypothetical protein
MLAASRFQPGAHALPEVGDDLVGDPAIDVLDLGPVSVSFGYEVRNREPLPVGETVGVQAERGFAGTRLHGDERSEGGGSWAEVPCGARRGSAPKPGEARSAAFAASTDPRPLW